jgi:hypothetical protein
VAGDGGAGGVRAQRPGRLGKGDVRASDNRRRQLLVLGPMLIVFYAVAFHVLDSGTSRYGGVFAAIGVALAALAVRPFLLLAVMPCLGARPVHVRVGVGPFLGFRVTPGHSASFRALPITFRAVYRPQPARYGRDLRVSMGISVLSPLALTLVGAPLLPPYARALCVIIGLGHSGAEAVSRRPGSPRTLAARAFHTVAPRVDPQIAYPDWGHIANGLMAPQFGDFDTAAAEIEYLKGRGHRDVGGIEKLLQRVRGDYGPLMQASIRSADAGTPQNAAQRATRQAVLGRLAFVALLAAERDPSSEARAAVVADQTLPLRGDTGRLPDAVDDSLRVRALLALLEGDPDRCLRLARRQLAAAASPLVFADGLCTRARAQAANGDLEGARATLGRAAGFAPWYARVGIVQALLGFEAAAPPPEPTVSAAGTARLFEDPWSTSEV